MNPDKLKEIEDALLSVHKGLSDKPAEPTPHVAKEVSTEGFLECVQCKEMTAILMDGCPTCTNPECGYSKCG